ncbi:MAG TPA: carboxypeptidase regulatory-like domain-containing protein [Bryobacteraceae bacterium]|nr:carboxypeptidase regulatory-like domain-containing protein [Bryobacteraceae bacterium]
MWVVEGTISNDAGPIPGATVWCRTKKATNEVLTDQSGAYTFKGPVAGLIMIGAEKEGYAPATGRAVNAQMGIRVGKVNILLRREGVVSGRVLDPNGDPMQGVEVDLWEKVFRDGKPTLRFRGQAHTNDLGEYRIAGVGTEGYVLEALLGNLKPRTLVRSGNKKAAQRAASFGVVRKMFYSNADSLEAATPIRVQPGQQAEGLDMRLRSVETFCFDATVRANNTTMSIRETPESGGAFIGRADVKAGQAFQMCGLPAAQYRLTIWSRNQAEATPAGKVVAFSRTDFAITDRDVSLGVLPAMPVIQLTGAVAVAGASTAPRFLSDLTAKLAPLEDRPISVSGTAAHVGPSGAFEFQSVFSDLYRLRLTGLPQGYYVKQLTQNGRDIPLTGLRPEAGPISILLGSDGAIVEGRVTDKEDLPVHDAVVALMPKDAQDGARVLSQPSSQDGGFAFSTDVAPGEYHIAAFTGLAEGEEQNTDFVRAHLGDAQEITLAPGSNQRLALQVETLQAGMRR